MVDARGRAGFAQQPFTRRRHVRGAADHFDRHQPAELFVARGVDDTHSPFAKRVDDDVAADGCARHGDVQERSTARPRATAIA